MSKEKLKQALEKYTQLDIYKRGGLYRAGEPDKLPDETYCNNFARDFLDSRAEKKWVMGWLISEYDYDIRLIAPDKSLFDIICGTPIEIAYPNLIHAANIGLVKELKAEKAQARANEGIPIHVISKKYYHEAIVCPDDEPFNEWRGVLIGQAGIYNGICYLSDKRSWGAYSGGVALDPEIKYYEYHQYDD